MNTAGKNDLYPSSRFVRSAKALFTRIDGDVLALNPEAGYCYAMENVAGAVMNLLEKPKTVDDLCGDLMREYDVERSTCEHDVSSLLKLLLAEGLIVQIQS